MFKMSLCIFWIWTRLFRRREQSLYQIGYTTLKQSHTKDPIGRAGYDQFFSHHLLFYSLRCYKKCCVVSNLNKIRGNGIIFSVNGQNLKNFFSIPLIPWLFKIRHQNFTKLCLTLKPRLEDNIRKFKTLTFLTWPGCIYPSRG